MAWNQLNHNSENLSASYEDFLAGIVEAIMISKFDGDITIIDHIRLHSD